MSVKFSHYLSKQISFNISCAELFFCNSDEKKNHNTSILLHIANIIKGLRHI